MAEQELTLRLRRGSVLVDTFTVLADPKDIAAIQRHGRVAAKRNGWSEQRFAEFVVEVEESGRWGSRTVAL